MMSKFFQVNYHNDINVIIDQLNEERQLPISPQVEVGTDVAYYTRASGEDDRSQSKTDLKASGFGFYLGRRV